METRRSLIWINISQGLPGFHSEQIELRVGKTYGHGQADHFRAPKIFLPVAVSIRCFGYAEIRRFSIGTTRGRLLLGALLRSSLSTANCMFAG
jgi:hypothetical protein